MADTTKKYLDEEGLKQLISLIKGADAKIQNQVNSAFNTVSVTKNDQEKNIIFEFQTVDGTTHEITIDTTDFYVHGMLDTVDSITLTNENVSIQNSKVFYLGTELPSSVIKDIFGTETPVESTPSNLPQTYLVMGFALADNPKDDSVHKPETQKKIWVNVSKMVQGYTFTGDPVNPKKEGEDGYDPRLDPLINVQMKGSNVEITSTDKLKTAVDKQPFTDNDINMIWENTKKENNKYS